MPLYDNINSNIPEKPITDKVLILDLDNTLIYSYESLKSYINFKAISTSKITDIKDRLYKFEYDEKEAKIKVWGTKRPALKPFIYFCFCYFRKVCVWSAGTKDYVDYIVREIFKDFRMPDVVWSREKCKIYSVFEEIKHDDGTYEKVEIKNTEKILQEFCDAYPDVKIEKLFIIDDNKKTFVHNPGNAINIPEYKPRADKESLSRSDPSLQQIASWLLQSHVINSEDVRLLDKSTIFTTDLITYNNLI